jgi:hypothetical protein
MSYKESGLIIKEVHGLHADNRHAQKKFQKEVLKTGKMPEVLNMKIDANEAKTKKLVEVFFGGAMLDPDL